MNGYHDPELDDVLQDDELRRIATMLRSARTPEPPLDDAFRTGLRRQLMQQAWTMAEGGESWWRRPFGPQVLAWGVAAAGIVLIASVVIYMSSQPPAGPYQLSVSSDINGSRTVALQQPILVHFNQPMDHQSTEAAVQITPATTVAYSWEGNTLEVTPTSGNLAPNTQYQVTIGSGARTATQQPLSQPQTITFVTQPETQPSPLPTPRPTPTSSSLLTGEKQLAPLAGASTAREQWAADSSAVYFIDGAGALNVVPANGGAISVIAPNGVTSLSVAPAGDRLAYVRAGKIEVLTFDSGKTDELAVDPGAVLVGWSQTNLVWVAKDGSVHSQASGRPVFVPQANVSPMTFQSISPDGAHAAFSQDGKLFVVDLASGNSSQLGGSGAAFLGWSPGGSKLLYGTGTAVIVSDVQGNTQARLPSGDPSWSGQDAILLGTDTEISQVRPDGSASTKLSNGTYHFPVWAPNGSLFTYIRGGNLYVAAAPALPPQPTALDLASSTVTSFMAARVINQPDQAVLFLDDKGKLAYEADEMHLVIPGDPFLSRSYILTQEIVSTDPDTARVVVRLVLTHGKIDVSEFDETLTLVRDQGTMRFLIHQATASSRRDLGKGADVVGVAVTADTIKVTFDSDLDPGTINDGVLLLDSKGKRVGATVFYDKRVLTLSQLELKPGARYQIVVLPTLRDYLGHNVASEYDLDVLGPGVMKQPAQRHQVATANPSPSPTPIAGATPAG